MNVYDTELYCKDLEERVEELEDAIEIALMSSDIDKIKAILEDVY